MPENNKQVVAYFMHEYEEQDVIEMLSPDKTGNEGKRGLERTASFVVGDATPQEIASMRERGILIQELDERPRFEGRKASVSETFSAGEREQNQRFLMQLVGPMLEDRSRLLRNYGVSLVEALPNDQYRIDIKPDQAEDVKLLPFGGTQDFALVISAPGITHFNAKPFNA